MDRWVRHGGRYPLLMLRIFRHGKGRIEDRWMDEHITSPKVGPLSSMVVLPTIICTI